MDLGKRANECMSRSSLNGCEHTCSACSIRDPVAHTNIGNVQSGSKAKGKGDPVETRVYMILIFIYHVPYSIQQTI